MDIGIGLPNSVIGTRGPELVDWAREAEGAGFSSLGTIDRIAYPSHEPLVSLAAAAAVTERIGLLTSILLAPLRINTALFAKQSSTVNAISGGRLTLGLAVGGREDDFEASGVDFSTRGRAFDRQLEELHELWNGKEVGIGGPVTPDGAPTVILGGSVKASFRRAARYGAGWIMGRGPPDAFEKALPQLESAWSEAGRDGSPRKLALGYYSLGPNAEELAQRSIGGYYGFLGEEGAKQVAGSAARSAEQVKGVVAAFEASGCDEYIFFPSDGDPEQVRLLREALD
ncbi:MAG: LLM class flavin-dependent oxidoreductase [Actinobacteria bacterium]|nr:MAG: LLM class flavin-dependent oxidoreductase [Actinomycetota bacterium]